MKIKREIEPDKGGNKRVVYVCDCGKEGVTRLSRFDESRSCISCTTKKQNDYHIKNGIVYMDVSTKKFSNAVCMFDQCFLDRVIDGGGRWFATDYSSAAIYVARSNKGIKLHRYLLEVEYGDVVDHIDGNGLNNLLTNIRICSQGENAKNQAINKNNKTGAIGVYKHSQIDKYVAQIRINRKTIHLGCYDSIEEAKEVREEWQKKYGYHENHGKRSTIRS
jgi:hypothetical protein